MTEPFLSYPDKNASSKPFVWALQEDIYKSYMTSNVSANE